MLSAAASVGSPCLLDVKFAAPYDHSKFQFVIWKFEHFIVKASNENFHLSHAENTYTLFIKCVHKIMAGKVTCELREQLTPTRSRVLQQIYGQFFVLNLTWFNNPGGVGNIISQYDGRAAFLPQVPHCDPSRPTTIKTKDNKLLNILVPEINFDNSLDTILICIIYRFPHRITYVKVLYDPFTINVHKLEVKLKRKIKISQLKSQHLVQIKWEFGMLDYTCFTFEVSDQAGVFPNISPIPHTQVSKRTMVTIVTPPKQTLIAVRIRTARPLPGEPVPDYKHVVLSSPPALAPAREPTAGPSNRN